MNMKGAFIALAAVGAMLTGGFIVGGVYTTDNSEYVVEKTVNGVTTIQDTPNWYVNYGTEDYYRFLATLDFTPDDTDALKDRNAYPVKYNDANGNVEGTLSVEFPSNDKQRLLLHSKYGSQKGAMDLLVDKAMQEAFNMTAVLMKSQEAYMTHRAIFREYALDQLQNGLYKTYIEEVTEIDSEGKETVTAVTRIAYKKDENGKDTLIPLRASKSPLEVYGITVANLAITNMGFDTKTVAQIDLRRDAENAVIISKANADRAAQETKEQQQIALKNKAIAKGKAEVIKEQQVVNAQRVKEVAEIKAKQQVAVAKQLKLQREEEYQAAIKEAKKIDTLSIAKADAADREINAGGKLSAAQQTTIAVNQAWAEAYAKKAVPQYNVGDAAMGDSSMDATQSAMQTLQLKAASELVNK